MIKSIPYGKQDITEADIKAVVRVLRSDFLTQGPEVLKFEQAFGEYIGCKYAVAVSNGTAALHLSALALGVKPGTKVITTPITFAATANSVLYCGGEVEFADVDPETVLLDINEVRKKLENAPKGTYSGIIPVDFAGYPVNMEAFRALADEHGLWIIEDACHAPGGYFTDSLGKKQNCGNGKYAELAVFSFHPVKHIACGEGGMITTNNEELYQKLLRLRTHGITKDPELLQKNDGAWYYEMQELGFNYRLTDIQAALGCSQLKKADARLQTRCEIAKRYDEALRELPAYPIHLSAVGHAYHLYIIVTKDRLELYRYLREHQIYAQIHYIPCHLMPHYLQYGGQEGDFPYAENYYRHCISLPIYPTFEKEHQEFVAKKVKKFYHQ